jgi:flagellar biosynthesis/type III secretory pathway M-ring protein FliF/YscJ
MQRGDQIVVESVAFDKTYLEQEKKEMDKLATKDMVSNGIKTGSIIFVTLIIFLFVLSMMRHQSVVKKAASEVRRAKDGSIIPIAGQTTLSDVITPGGVAAGSKEPELNKQLEILAREKPKEVAEALKNWISGT